MSWSPVSAALALCALSLPVSIAASNLALVLLTLALLARARGDGRAIWRAWRAEPALPALIAYVAASLLSALLSGSAGPALKDTLKDAHRLWSLAAFVAALALEPGAPIRPALGAAFSTMALLGIWQSATGEIRGDMMVRAHGFVHPVVFGAQMALASLGGACVLLRPTPKAPRAAAAAFTALTAVALLLSQTRMAVFAAGAGFGLVMLLEPRARRHLVPLALALVGAALAWELLPTGGRSLSALLDYDAKSPHHARWALWDAALRMFRDHPWTGVGPGGYGREFMRYHPGALDNQFGWSSAHNLFLHQLAERGLIGVLALLPVCAALLLRAVRAARIDADTRALWAAGTMGAFLTLSLTETSFQNEQFATLLLLLWAWGTTTLRPRA